MADDLVERLRIKADMIHFGETIAWGSDVALMHEAAARITDLEARLAAAEANVNRLREGEARLSLLLNETAQARDAAEAGEDALADCIRDFLHETGAYRPHERKAMTALAAYEARREG